MQAGSGGDTTRDSADFRDVILPARNPQGLDDRLKFLLELNSRRVDKCEIALERNWIIHLILAGVGIALVLDIGNLPGIVAKYFSQPQYDKKAVAVIILPLLLYHFTKFGHLLTTFVGARRLQDSMLSEYLGSLPDRQQMKSTQATTNFFEVFYSAQSFAAGRLILWPYLILTSVIFSGAQASALFLVVQAYGFNVWSVAALVVATTILSILYYAFWESQKTRPRGTLVVVTSIALMVGWLVVFAELGQ